MYKSILDYANEFRKTGIATIPIQYKDKRPDFNLLPKNEDGNSSWERYKTELPSYDDLSNWFLRGQHNYGVVTGWSNLVVLDFDLHTEYVAWGLWGKHYPIANYVFNSAFQVKTGRGVHVYIRTINPERNRNLRNIDIKANSGYVLGVGSIHPSGAMYEQIRKIWNFPVVQALSDVLPANLLLSDNTVKAKPVQVKQVKEYDMWEAAANPFVPQSDLIGEIKKRYSVESFFPDATDTHGGRYKLVCCPFHDDKNPSFWVDVDMQICGCYAGCTDKPLDVINLYARLYSLSNVEAIKALAKGL